MNIGEILSYRDFSKELALKIVAWIDYDADRMDELMQLFFHGNQRLTQRAAYPLIFITDEKPFLFKPYLEEMIDFMSDDKHDAVIRNTLRLFNNIEIPENIEGKLFDKCIHYLASPKYPVAIRVFAMTILTKTCVKYPELKAEVKPLIEDILEISESPGLHSRGRKMMKLLNQIPDAY